MSGTLQRDHHRRTKRGSASGVHTVAVSLLVLAATAVVLARLLTPVEAPSPASWTTVAVPPTGTLWELASLHPVAGLTTAQTVELIQDENGLDSGVLYAGQSLRVPGTTTSSATSVAQR